MDREETVLSASGEKMKHRILVVEDDPPFRELLGGWLEKEGFDAVLADTLEAAFMGIAAIPLPDAVLLDIHLGSQSGLTLVHWARKQKHLAHRSEEHTSELQSRQYLVCRLLLEKKKLNDPAV